MYSISLWFIGLLVLSLAACTKTISVPALLTEPDFAEDPVFSTLDFATPQADHGKGLVVNGSDLYVVGNTRGDLDGTNLGEIDVFLRRYDGGKLWGVQFGTREEDVICKVDTDSNGNVYVVGQTKGPFGFQVGTQDTFLAKFNQDGEIVWAKQLGTKDFFGFCSDLAVSSNNQIYVLSFDNVNFNGFVIRKFNSGGSLLKTKSVILNNRPSLHPEAMAIDSSDRVLVLADWDNSGNGKGQDIRLFKYNSNLNQIWQQNYGTPDNEHAYDVTTDSNSNIYFTLRITGGILGQGGHFVKKSASGNTLYTRRLEPSLAGKSTLPRSITTDSNNNIYIAGGTKGSFSGFSNAGSNDIVVFKYNSSGTQQWTSQFDNGNYGSADNDFANDVAVNGAVYITGSTSGNLLDGTATSYGSFDAYVAKLNRSNGTILGVDQ